MTVEVTDCDPFGIPFEARCEQCGQWWARPAADPAATTLVLFELVHDRRHRASCRRDSTSRRGERP